eukprot:766645-Hanusia_phi.AAC.3
MPPPDSLELAGHQVVGDEQAVAVAVLFEEKLADLLGQLLALMILLRSRLELLQHLDKHDVFLLDARQPRHFVAPEGPHEEERQADGIGEEEQDDAPEDWRTGVGGRAGDVEVDQEILRSCYFLAHESRRREDGEERIDQEAPAGEEQCKVSPLKVGQNCSLTRRATRTKLVP